MIRLETISSILLRSMYTIIVSFEDIKDKLMFFSLASVAKENTNSLKNFTIFIGWIFSFIPPESIFDKSRSWVIKREIRRLFLCINSKSFFKSPFFSFCSHFSIGPKIKVNGVRNSCEMFVKNSDLSSSIFFCLDKCKCSSSNSVNILILLLTCRTIIKTIIQIKRQIKNLFPFSDHHVWSKIWW